MKIAEISKRYFRPHDTSPLVGDSSNIESTTGWRRTRNLPQIIEEMVMEDVGRREEGKIDV